MPIKISYFFKLVVKLPTDFSNHIELVHDPYNFTFYFDKNYSCGFSCQMSLLSI